MSPEDIARELAKAIPAGRFDDRPARRRRAYARLVGRSAASWFSLKFASIHKPRAGTSARSWAPAAA